ncbi:MULTISPECIES: carbohydrate porin [Chryseobacterium]|uniref:High affinity Mn2+ porin n=1 Tax=Chryseobacterium camelliae TaxID=1265445 RepID=A0ABU0TI26_9FLAO|nr:MULTISPECIES: carbohydrate porin [Chryseobacterium]MDT3409432.1 high affinity Mn2+ porin [Pseudacidovorax intermedius]MDQ1096703.1 high affinity Mn2+ porin [Chryseobacterium camelliae]MDQ1100647.1 high affinity Mn2+ porin [Chryseobacterium sp. SORGH_AS_1048]MDR6087985.1 high affinity Mn2+ porin [Chryseobacterium sp. SORGH_AS_0909]MDR6132360.1 high affinity Mn2+ porin [Chryseobacterium sp. SORGH_AS_1175]
MKTILRAFAAVIMISNMAMAQDTRDTAKSGWTAHFQSTVIAQKHSGFPSPYSGDNSLANNVEPAATSLTGTLFLGRRLWKGATLYVNPEVSGGKGLSFATGVAGALNGETYRVGEVSPQVFIARAYIRQHIALSHDRYEYLEDDNNQVAETVPANRITISAGKFAVSDFFDGNAYSKDPRTQFFNWSMWANGAWDYPANTRGYTFGAVVEIIKPQWVLRLSSVAVPRIANFHLMEYRISKAHSETAELEHQFSIRKNPGRIRLIVSHTQSQAPSYQDGLEALSEGNMFLLNVIRGKEEHNAYGGKKTAIGLNLEQQLTSDIGFFSRAGWNDGKYVTWAFTEIDHTINAGFSVKGSRWKRPDDVVGIGYGINGISEDHKDFLKAGGYGFIIGDGKLNYGSESILEMYYNAKLTKFLWATFDYQYVHNPAYNRDRGPVHVFGIRSHIQF